MIQMDDLFEALFAIIIVIAIIAWFIEYVLPFLLIAICILGPAGAASVYTGTYLQKNIRERYQLTWMSTSTLLIIAFLTLFVGYNFVIGSDNWVSVLSVIFIVPVALLLALGTLNLWARSKTKHIHKEISKHRQQVNRITMQISRKEVEISQTKRFLQQKQQKHNKALELRLNHYARVSEICRKSAEPRAVILGRDSIVKAAIPMNIRELKRQKASLQHASMKKNGANDEMKFHILSALAIDKETGNAAKTIEQKKSILQKTEDSKQRMKNELNEIKPNLQRAENNLSSQRIVLN